QPLPGEFSGDDSGDMKSQMDRLTDLQIYKFTDLQIDEFTD
ncbi:MAG: hypothetical protein H6Q21_2570, partial [Bacteroidetes bacterium]|nr:hypothetical protein [Bacteroidota bacterium]